MKADHGAALNFANYRTGEGWDETTETHNLSVAYLELHAKLEAVSTFLDDEVPHHAEDAAWIRGWHYCKATIRRILNGS